MILAYEAVDAKGRQMRDTVEAADAGEAVEQLRRRGLYVTHLAEASASACRKRGLRAAGRSRITGSAGITSAAGVKMPLNALVMFTRQMAMLLQAGSAVVPAVAAIKRQVRKPGQAAVLERLIVDLEDGMSLTEALRRYPRTFDPIYCAIIAAGEAGGTLTEMFHRLAAMVAKRRALRNKVLGALAYPALLVCMSCGILLSLLFFVIPRFRDMFTQLGVSPPPSTMLMLSTASLITTYWPVLSGLLAALIAGTVFLLSSQAGRQWLSNVQLCIPLVGRLRSRLIQGQVFRTMGMLLESGVGVLDALELIRESTRSKQFHKLFNDLEEAVTSGGRMSSVFEQSGLVEPYVCQAVHTGEDSGSLGSALTYCADILDETNTELIGTVMKLVEPIILIGMGLVVGTVAVSLFLPLFDLTSAMR